MDSDAASFSSFFGRRSGVACPACGVSPLVGTPWTCSPDGCGGQFDTFETHGRCPHCDAQFRWTQCPSCGRASAHNAWYRPGASE